MSSNYFKLQAWYIMRKGVKEQEIQGPRQRDPEQSKHFRISCHRITSHFSRAKAVAPGMTTEDQPSPDLSAVHGGAPGGGTKRPQPKDCLCV